MQRLTDDTDAGEFCFLKKLILCTLKMKPMRTKFSIGRLSHVLWHFGKYPSAIGTARYQWGGLALATGNVN